MGTLRFFEEVVSFKIRRTFGFADYTAWFPIPALAASFLALDRGLGPVCPVSFCFFVFYPEALSEPANKKTVYHNRQTASLLSVSRLDYVRSGHVLRREPRCLFLHT